MGGLDATELDADRDEASQGTGGAYYNIGISYDFFPFYEGGSGGLAFTPTLQYLVFTGDVFQASLFTIGVELTWWTGLDKQELDLSEDEAYEKD